MTKVTLVETEEGIEPVVQESKPGLHRAGFRKPPHVKITRFTHKAPYQSKGTSTIFRRRVQKGSSRQS